MEKKPLTPLAAGLVVGLTSVVLFLVYYFTGLVFQQNLLAWLPAVVTVILLIVLIGMWSNAKDNFVTFGSCFGFGFKTVCIATLIVFFFSLVFIYLTPDYKTQALQMMKEKMRENKQATDEQVETGMNWMTGHFMLVSLGGTLFGNLLVGVIGALIGAAVAKKKPFNPFIQVNQIGETQP